MSKKILIVALGDVYWTRFAKFFSLLLDQHGMECVIALESRVGEYQAFLGRTNYGNAKVYYLTDFIDQIPSHNLSNVSVMPVFCDYLRMSLLGQGKQASAKDWLDNAKFLDLFSKYVLDQEQVSLVIADTVSTGLSFTFNQEAARRGIAYWGLSGSRITGHFITASTIRDEAEVVRQLYAEIISGLMPLTKDEQLWAEEYLGKIDSQVPDYMRSPMLNTVSLGKFFHLRYFKTIFGSLLYCIKEKRDKRNVLLKASPLNGICTAAYRNFKRLIKSPFVFRYYASKSDFVKGENYFIYPIHYQPEASTVVCSPYHTDQLNLIRNLAFSMPKGFRLYVKEHISNFGFPDMRFYSEISSLPNVVLVDHREDMKSLIRKSQGVITLTSTAGFEALLLKKPVFYFGNVFYTCHSSATRLADWYQVEHVLQERKQCSDFDNVAFLVAYKRYATEGKIDFSKVDFGIAPELLEKVLTH